MLEGQYILSEKKEREKPQDGNNLIWMGWSGDAFPHCFILFGMRRSEQEQRAPIDSCRTNVSCVILLDGGDKNCLPFTEWLDNPESESHICETPRTFLISYLFGSHPIILRDYS